MDKIKTGIASFGMSGSVFHAPLLHANEKFTITKILERKAEKSAKKYPYATIVRTFDELIEDKNIELIVVNTPDHTHYEFTQKALKAGKHVVVEKPFVLDIHEGKKLIALAEKKKLVLSVFHNRRRDGDFLTVKRIINEGKCGRLVEYIAQYDRFRNFIRNSWKENPENGTGTIYNLGSHLIDQALSLFGMPLEVNADLANNRSEAKVNDYFHIRLIYNDLRVILKGSYLVREPGPRYMVHGTEGSYVKYGSDPQENALNNGQMPGGDSWGKEPGTEWGILHINYDNQPVRKKVETVAGNYPAYYDNIYEAIRQQKPLEITAKQGLAVIKIIEACMLSAKEKRNVFLDIS